MIPTDAYIKGFTAAFAGLLALLLVAGGSASRSSRILGVFLLLISLNSVAETMRVLVADPAKDVAWFRVASVAASLDPVALYWFAASYPRANELGRPARFVPVIAVGGLLALDAGWTLDAVPDPILPASERFPLLLSVFTAVIYVTVFAWSVHKFSRRPTEDGWRFIVPAFSVAALPSVTLRLLDRLAYLGRSAPILVSPTAMVVELACLVLVSLAIARAFLPRDRLVQLVVTASILLTAVIVLLVRLLSVVGLDVVGHAETAFRWTLFGVLASTAIFRGQALGWSLRVRRRASRFFLAAVFLLAAGTALLAVRGHSAADFEGGAVLLVAVMLSQGFTRVVDRVALAVYGVPRSGDLESAKLAYARASTEALARGRSPGRDPEIQRLREQLDLSAETASVIEKMAEERFAGPLALGQLAVGRYRIQRLVGRGATGRVFLARDILLDRDVALKEILSEQGDEERLREARSAGAVQHPNVVTVHDLVRRRGASYLVAEFVERGSLALEIRSAGRLPVQAGLPRFQRLVEGVAAVHAKGIIHRDITPQNVLVSGDGELKLGDFGLAVPFRTRTAQIDDPLAGTPEWMSPEQRSGNAPSAASDVYALGLLMRWAMEGPFPPELRAVVDKATREDPRQRWRDARELADALRAVSFPKE
jgi:hypothetical protein